MYYKTILNFRRATANDEPLRGYRHREFREMGFTAEEFARCLPLAVRGRLEQDSADANRYRIEDGRDTVVIDTRCLPARRLGSLVLPVLGVTIDFSGDSAAAWENFIARFERHFLRMGG